MDMVAAGARIKECRKFKGLSREQLAEKTGISVMSLRRYEGGQRQATEDVFKRISLALDVDINYLMNGKTLAERNAEMKAQVDTRFESITKIHVIPAKSIETLINAMATFPTASFLDDKYTLADIFNGLITQPAEFCTMLSFIQLATSSRITIQNCEHSSIDYATRRGYIEQACDCLRKMVENMTKR